MASPPTLNRLVQLARQAHTRHICPTSRVTLSLPRRKWRCMLSLRHPAVNYRELTGIIPIVLHFLVAESAVYQVGTDRPAHRREPCRAHALPDFQSFADRCVVHQSPVGVRR